MDTTVTTLLYGLYVPLIVLTVLTFAIVEAAGGASDYEKVSPTVIRAKYIAL